MVIPTITVQTILRDFAAVAASDGSQRVIERLDPRSRGIVLLSLTALVLIAILLVLLTTAGGRWARRRARFGYGPTKSVRRSAARKRDPIDEEAPLDADDIDTAETIVAQRTDETRPPEG